MAADARAGHACRRNARVGEVGLTIVGPIAQFRRHPSARDAALFSIDHMPANNASDASATSTGIAYIAVCRPTALKVSFIVAAPALSIACRAKWSLSIPVPTGPKLAPKTYMAQKYIATAVPRR